MLILVDEKDQEIGYGEKLEVHRKGQLHRAFSVFLFDWGDYKMLLQKREQGKYHSGGLWTNACCSHPREGETLQEALQHCLKKELGLAYELEIKRFGGGPYMPENRTAFDCGQFTYRAEFDNGITEHEIDHVFLIAPDKYVPDICIKNEIHPSPEEVEAVKWVTIGELKKWMTEKPEDFTAWFPRAFELAYNNILNQAHSLGTFECMMR